jgi:serine/threonine protein kinase
MSDTSETKVVRTGDLLSWTGLPLLDESGDDLVGVTLNHTYAVERALGEGGMGRVYEARHTRIAQKRVAVKVLHPEFLGNAEVLARFQREAETAAAISHPNVVTVLDVDRTPHGLPYLVCEYLEGIDLADHLRAVGRLEVTVADSTSRNWVSRSLSNRPVPTSHATTPAIASRFASARMHSPFHNDLMPYPL